MRRKQTLLRGRRMRRSGTRIRVANGAVKKGGRGQVKTTVCDPLASNNCPQLPQNKERGKKEREKEKENLLPQQLQEFQSAPLCKQTNYGVGVCVPRGNREQNATGEVAVNENLTFGRSLHLRRKEVHETFGESWRAPRKIHRAERVPPFFFYFLSFSSYFTLKLRSRIHRSDRRNYTGLIIMNKCIRVF